MHQLFGAQKSPLQLKENNYIFLKIPFFVMKILCFSLNIKILFYLPFCLFLFSFYFLFNLLYLFDCLPGDLTCIFISKLGYAFRAISAPLRTLFFYWVWLLSVTIKCLLLFSLLPVFLSHSFSYWLSTLLSLSLLFQFHFHNLYSVKPKNSAE